MPTSLTDDSPSPRPARGASTLDLAFLHRQTFGDEALAREVLSLFRDQAGHVLPQLEGAAFETQTATAHLLKGWCRGIGAAAAADLLERYGAGDAAERRDISARLTVAFAALDRAIAGHLAASEPLFIGTGLG